MSQTSTDLEQRLARFVEHHVLHGEQLPVEQLCADRPDLAAALRRLVGEYLSVTRSLQPDEGDGPWTPQTLPQFDGFQTIERLGSGGMGEVYKLKDLQLDRIVAGKIVRRGGDTLVSGNNGLRSAKSCSSWWAAISSA